MGDFEKAITPDVDEHGRWSGEIAEGWDIAGHTHGGYLLALAARIALGVTGRDHPLAVSAHYLRPPAPGPVHARTTLLRSGRSTAVAAVDLVQDDQPVLATLVTTGRLALQTSASRPFHQATTAPRLPPVEDCPSAATSFPPAGGQGLHDHVEVRLDPNLGSLPGAPRDRAEMRGWTRLIDGGDPDPLFLLLAADALPPTTFQLGIFGWVPTVELSVLVRGVPAPGWLRVVMRTALIDDGWLDEDVEVWDSEDCLVAQARQLAVVRLPTQP